MCSLIWGTGWRALARASHRGHPCLCRVTRAPRTVPHLYATCLRVCGPRFKSSAALRMVGGKEGAESSEGAKEGGKDGLPHKTPIKVMVIRGGCHMKVLRSLEAPVLHHARARRVVDMAQHSHSTASTAPAPHSTAPAPHSTHSTQEIHLTVDQLLRESRKSLHSATATQQAEEPDYASDRDTRRPQQPALVGALPAGALDWRPQVLDLRRLGPYYADLAKSRLTGLVVLTAVAGYAMAPAPLDPTTLLLTALGTALVSGAANAVNQCLEVPFDSQMDRTKTRILVRGLISPLHAVSAALVCGGAGVGMLYWGANGLAAALGAVNLVLYTSVYTPMKRLTILNTWLGAVVGAIPPLIGWAGCVGELGAGAGLMALVLYSWQFPHFNALSWNLRPDYSRAGYRMMAVTDPGLCRRVALRHSLAMVAICTAAPALDVTTWTFAADSLPFNGYLVYLAWKFYQDADSNSSRKLFFFSLVHLPVILMLMIISKKHYGRNKKTETAAGVSEEAGTKRLIPLTSSS